jgi:hypothetical protein
MTKPYPALGHSTKKKKNRNKTREKAYALICTEMKVVEKGTKENFSCYL